jgi:hypothetical protein
MQSQSQSSKPCGARTRRGTPCPTPALPNGRCRKGRPYVGRRSAHNRLPKPAVCCYPPSIIIRKR